MKKYLFFLILFTASISALSQIRILSSSEIAKLFPDSTKKKFNIQFPIRIVYETKEDKSSTFSVLTESNDSITAKDTFHFSLKGLILKKSATSFERIAEFSDFRIKAAEESSIWFWTKYCEFSDLDSDGVVDPIFIYGSRGANGFDDGRIKILLYYKGKKIALRHQNGVLDFERALQVDIDFYSVPVILQDKVKSIMKKIETANLAIFPGNWEEAMKLKKVKIDERN